MQDPFDTFLSNKSNNENNHIKVIFNEGSGMSPQGDYSESYRCKPKTSEPCSRKKNLNLNMLSSKLTSLIPSNLSTPSMNSRSPHSIERLRLIIP